MNLRDNVNVLGKITEMYKAFSVPAEKLITDIDKDGNERDATFSSKIKVIDSTRFMASLCQIS